MLLKVEPEQFTQKKNRMAKSENIDQKLVPESESMTYTVNHEYWPIFWPPFPAAWFTAQLFLTCSGRSLVTDLTMEAGLL